MARTISGPVNGTVTLVSGDNPVTVDSSGNIYGANSGILGDNSSAWTVTNQGTITGSGYHAGTLAGGIILQAGGSISNAAGGAITAYDVGVYITGATGTVSNSGEIGGASSSLATVGIALDDGGTVSNDATDATITGALYGVSISGASGTVVNVGLISSQAGFVLGSGVVLDQGGLVQNNASGGVLGTITAYAAGVHVTGSAGTIVNYGSIAATAGYGVLLQEGGTITNGASGAAASSADIYGLRVGIYIGGADGTIVNYGAIASGLCGCSTQDGVWLADGGSVTNAASAQITGYLNGVHIAAAPGTVTNVGLIRATAEYTGGSDAIRLDAGGTIVNGISGASASAAEIYGDGFGVYVTAGAATVVNYGTIESGICGCYTYDGVRLRGGGSVTNAANAVITGYDTGVYISGGSGTVINAGKISATSTVFGGRDGIYLRAGGSVANDAATASIIGGIDGVLVDGGTGTVSNSGTITGLSPLNGGVAGSMGVQLDQGGSVTNSANGVIEGYFSGINIFGPVNIPSPGTYISEGLGTVINLGTVTGDQGPAVELDDGGTVVNGNSVGSAASISSGGGYGVWIRFTNSKATSVAGIVTNYGSITGGGNSPGVELDSGGILTNGPSATITGYFGVQLSGPNGVSSTLVNAGTITATGPSNVAVNFLTPNDLLVIKPGAVFNGQVFGGVTSSMIELASASSVGSLHGLGSSIVGFGSIVVDAGATWTLTGANTLAAASAVTLGNGASLDVTGTLAGGVAFALGGASLELANAPDVNDTFDFADTAGVGPDTLTLDAVSGTSLSNSIANFSFLDDIILPGVTFAAGSTPTLGANTLTVDLQGGGSFVFNNFTLASGAPASFTVGTHSVQDAVCFAAGTHIAAPGGERRVEQLAVGDLVVTTRGTTVPIVWIGVGRVLLTPGRRNAATPVIVRKGALADNVPHRDLRVTKGHALLLDGVLIPVEFLVNHRSIIWDDRAREIDIFHIELSTHDVLLAENAPAESYRDDGNRWLFRNGNSGWMHPAQPPCAPVLTGGTQVDAIWRRLLDRTGARPGQPMTDQPDLHLLVDGKRVDCHLRSAGVHVFPLATPPAEVRIISRAGVPAELGLARDERPLGVALRRIVLWQGRAVHQLQADDPILTNGFHGFEAANEWRWTDGDAALPATFLRRLSGSGELELHVGCTARYPLATGEGLSEAA